MTKKDDDNPLEEIQKQLRDLMNNKNVQVAFAPFMESMKGKADDAKEEKKSDKPSTPPPEDISRDEQLDAIRSFDRRPKEIRDYLDRFVIKQEQAKRVLSVAVCDHITMFVDVWRMRNFPNPSMLSQMFCFLVQQVWGKLS